MPVPSLRTIVSAIALALSLGAASSTAHAIGSAADINVVDRNTGQVLPVYAHQGRHYVAGRPGARYAVRVHNKAGGRVMTVISVDGINVVSGDSAGWEQNGYVLAPWQRHDVAGWRKSQSQVAAFEFTALPNSYAARTGRPDHVGVIGVAVFRERLVPVQLPAPVQMPVPAPRPYGGLGASSRDDLAAGSGTSANAVEGQPAQRAERSGPATAEAPAAEAAPAARKSLDSLGSNEERALSRVPAQAESKLGTGHGARENAWVNYTEFERAQSTPDEVITIYYDSRDNLVAQGVIPTPRVVPVPQAFPVPPQTGFVPDPPRL